MLPPGKKSLFEINGIYDPADRLTNAAMLLEYSLVQRDPHFRREDGSAPSLSDRIRRMEGQGRVVWSILQAVHLRNRVVHAQGEPVTEGEMDSAARVLLEAIDGLLPSLAANVAQAIRGGPSFTVGPQVQTPAVNFRGIIFAHHEQGANGQLGMSLLVTFMAISMQGRTGIILINFLDRFGSALPDIDRNYCNVRGEVALSARFTPESERFDYRLFRLFMPYQQLHLAQGRHIIRCRASAYLVEGQQTPMLAEFREESFSVVRTGHDYLGGAA